MTKTDEAVATSRVVYSLEGTLLEACSCDVLCPCWIGEDPDQGTCYSFNAYHFERGQVKGVDVSGLSFVWVNQIPGNVLIPNSWRTVFFVDERATPEQEEALVGLFTGRHGGPLGDLAGLIGDVVGIERAPIRHELVGGAGRLVIPGVVESEMAPYHAPDGTTITTLRDSLFSTVPGSPAYVAKASVHRVTLPRYGMEWSYEGRNAIQSDYGVEFVS